MKDIKLEGQYCELEIMKIQFSKKIYEISRDDRIWKYLSMYPKSYDEIDVFVKNAITKFNEGNSIPFVISSSGQIVGTTRILDINNDHQTCEIGLTWIIPDVWGTKVSIEAHYLMFKYCFEEMKFRRIQFKIDENNLRSYKSIEKLGGKREGLLRNFRNYNNKTYTNTYIYSIIFEEWENIKKNLLIKLYHENK